MIRTLIVDDEASARNAARDVWLNTMVKDYDGEQVLTNQKVLLTLGILQHRKR